MTTRATKKVTVKGGASKNVRWPANQDGYYDVVITASTSDGFRRRTRAASPEEHHVAPGQAQAPAGPAVRARCASPC